MREDVTYSLDVNGGKTCSGKNVFTPVGLAGGKTEENILDYNNEIYVRITEYKTVCFSSYIYTSKAE